jgi:Zn-dependent protease with chaperone function
VTAETAVEREPRRAHALDERLLSSGTTLRFLLLLVLFSAGSLSMTSNLAEYFSGSTSHQLECNLADGFDPSAPYRSQQAFTAAQPRSGPLAACFAHAPNVAWVPFAVTAALIAAAYGLYRLLPIWKGRSSQVTLLEEVDVRGTLQPLLDALVAEAGLGGPPQDDLATETALGDEPMDDPVTGAALGDDLPPRFGVKATTTANAVVFGTRKRATVCLHGGLVALSVKEPDRFRAVVLHELAHVRNGDIGITYATVALWRVFLTAVLLPQVGWLAYGAFRDRLPVYFGDTAFETHALVQEILIVVLVCLARADILRTRELYADLDAVHWKASQKAWDISEGQRTDEPVRPARAWMSFLELWRTHPSWTVRRRSLTDSASLFALSALPMFITGAAADIASADLLNVLPSSGAFFDLQSLLLAGLIAAIAGVALWRAVAHAVLTGGRAPSGWRAGMWIGAGLALCELTDGYVVGDQWLPTYPEALLILVAMTVLVTVWTAQYAELKIRTVRGRSLRPAMVTGLLAPWLVLAFSLYWWFGQGFLLVYGWSWSVSSQLATIGLRGLPTAHPDLVLQIATVLIILPGIVDQSFGGLWWTVPLLWLMPLWAWTRRPLSVAPQWLVNALPDVPDPTPLPAHLPCLGRILRAGALGGLAACMGLLVVRAATHTQRRLFTIQWGGYELSFITWVAITVSAAAILTAIAVALFGPQRLLLLNSLITGGIASLIGLSFQCALATVDGCLGPLNVQSTACAWRPTQALNNGLLIALGDTLCLAVVTAAIAAAVVSAIRTLTTRGIEPRCDPTRAEDGAAARGLVRQRIVVGVITVAVVVAIASALHTYPDSPVGSPTTAAIQSGPTLDAPTGGQVPSSVQYLQFASWDGLGGYNLAEAFISEDNSFVAAYNIAADMSVNTRVKTPQVCVDLSRTVRKADAYFPLPIADGQRLWAQTIQQDRVLADACISLMQQAPSGTGLTTASIYLHNAEGTESAYMNWYIKQAG